MAPSAEPAGAWRAARVRFYESGRGRQTPVALDLGDGWRLVSLLGEELNAGIDSGQAVERRWRLADQDGGLYLLASAPEGGWRVRPWGRAKV